MDPRGILDNGGEGSRDPDDCLAAWVGALERRHLSALTFAEVARALRSLSSCYVERRSRLASGGALDGRGKRAAFALFYGPLHFLVTRHIVRHLRSSEPVQVNRMVDLGCGTGAAGAAWALEAGVDSVSGFDRSPWAIGEAAWTYRTLGLRGRLIQADAARLPGGARRGDALLLAYLVNELTDSSRARLLTRLLEAADLRGARVLVIEPIARRVARWWTDWEKAFTEAGGRADEWRFPAELPRLQRDLARAAGLDPRELTARSLAA